MAKTYMIGAGQSIDTIHIDISDKVQIAGDATINAGKTINTSNNVQITKSGAGKNPIVACQHHGVRVPPTVTRVVVKDISFNTPYKTNEETAGVSVGGKDCEVFDITQVGTGDVLRFDGAQRLSADMLFANNGNALKHGIYAGGDTTPNNGCTIKRFDIWIKQGTHGIRAHNHHDLTIGDPNLELRPGFKFAGYVKHTATQGVGGAVTQGTAITLKEGTNANIVRVLVDGAIGFGPLTDTADHKNPGWQSLALTGLTIDRCEINTPTSLHFGPAVFGIKVTDSIVRAVAPPVNHQYDRTKLKGAPLWIDSSYPKVTGEWKAPEGQFINVKFYGEKLCTKDSEPQLANFTFTNCTFNDKPLGPHGEIL